MTTSLRRLHILLAIALLASVPRLATATLTPGFHAGRSVVVGADTRSYDLYVPASYDGTQPYPLVVDFHPLGGTSAAWASTSGFRALADTQHFLIAFPQGIGGYWNGGTCCPPPSPTTDDVGFARALVADVQADANVDPDRVFATGYSMGSVMSHRLACDAADVFAAVAPFAAQLVVPFPDCQPSHPVAVLYTHGLDDTVVPYAGGATVPFPSVSVVPAPDVFRFLAQENGCCTDCLANPAGEPSTILDQLGDGDPDTRCEAYTSCTGGVVVELCSERPLGHSVPAGGPARAWSFMVTHARGATTTTTTTTTTTSSSTTTTTMPPIGACPATPRPDCVATMSPTSSILKLRDGGVPGRQSVVWKWASGGNLSAPQLGDPTVSTPYAFCLYDGSGTLFYAAAVPAAAGCDGTACWRGLGQPPGATGWRFKDKRALYDALSSILVTPGAPGRAKALVKGRGANPTSAGFVFPSPPLASIPTVQLIAEGGACVGATMTSVVKNVAGKYVARGGL